MAVAEPTVHELVGELRDVSEQHGRDSVDHPVRPLQYRRRDREPEALGRLEVDDKIDFRRLLDGQIARFRSAEYPADVPPGTAK
jgi:hypothetical protein